MIEERLKQLESQDLGLERDGRMRLSDHHERWPLEFAREARRISIALKIPKLQFHHVGSTAISGIKAKPILDILLVAPSLTELDEARGIFSSLGYEPKGEYGLEGRRYFTLSNSKTHKTYVHLHAWEAGHPQIKNHLVFRDFLRCHPIQAKEYESVKTDAVQRQSADRSKYIDLKAPVIERLLAAAHSWAEKLEKQHGFPRNWKLSSLQTERLELEPVTEKHAEGFCELFSDSELHQFVPFEVPTLAQTKGAMRAVGEGSLS